MSQDTARPPPPSLPRPQTSFVGRDLELAEASRLLLADRLLTLTGPGGSGKTRLGLRLATELAGEFPDGALFVSLAPVSDPSLVLPSIAQSLGLNDAPGRPLVEHLAAQLAQKRQLLILDNFEHLLAAAPLLAELLAATLNPHFLVTSRSPLRISGEQECPIPPLGLPAEGELSAEAVAACDSVRLFVERAGAAEPGFVVTGANARAVAQIVQRLDGLPLAIELAAARVNLLPPEALLERLHDSLGFLVIGSRDLPRRQRTLRETIAWSHDLLSEGARRLLAVCSVFRGGAQLETIESVCEETIELGLPVLEALQELVDQSLLRQVQRTGSARFQMLVTIREFASERLDEMAEAEAVRDAHAAAFLALAETGEVELTGPAQLEWLERLTLDHNNLRAAIDRYRLASPSSALRVAAALAPFWALRGHFREGREQLVGLLERVRAPSAVRVRALNGAASLAIDQGNYAGSLPLLQESLKLSRRLRDHVAEGAALTYLARAHVADMRGAEGTPYAERAIAILREAGDRPDLAQALMYAALCAMFSDRLDDAPDLFGQALAICREIGHLWVMARSLQMLGCAQNDRGELRAARVALEEGLPMSVRMRDWFVIPVGLGGFAGLAAKTGRPRTAVRLAAAAEAFAEAHDFASPRARTVLVQRWLEPVRRSLGPAVARLWAEGRRMTLEEAVACALANEPEGEWRPGPRHDLTRREREVAALVAQGLTNREVAQRLQLSVRTVEVHVDHILGKLEFRTRTQLGAWAYEEGLLAKDR